MKRAVPIILAFLTGGFVASACWGLYAFNRTIGFVAAATEANHGKARAGELILDYLEAPQPDKAARLTFIATNMVSGFLNSVDMCEQQYPYFHVRQHYHSEYDRYQAFLRERRHASAGSELDGAANGRQPFHSGTNSTSAAAASRR